MTAAMCGVLCASGVLTSGFYSTVILTLLLLLCTAGVALHLLKHRAERLGRELEEEKQARNDLSGFLSRFSTRLRGDEGFEGVMHITAANVAEKIEAESVCIYEFRNDTFTGAGVHGNYPLIHGFRNTPLTTRQHLLEALYNEKIIAGVGFPGSLLVSKEPVLIPDAKSDPQFNRFADRQTLGSVMAVPMLQDGAVAGIVCAVGNKKHPGHSFSTQQFESLCRFSPEIQMVQTLVQVYLEINRRDRIDQELHLTRQIQNSLLPSSFPVWGDFTIDARTRSAKEVNGDYYDFVEIDSDRLLVIIGDACGKGVPACMLTAMTRSFARSMANSFTTLPEFLAELNKKLFNDTQGDRFITVGCCLLNKRDSLLEFGRAGHSAMVTHVHNHIRIIKPDGTGLGIMPEDFASYETFCLSLDPGSTVMMYTDGMTEAINSFEEEFGTQRLIDAFSESCKKHTENSKIIDDLMSAVTLFEREQADDQTVVLIRRNGRV
ncbi:MAG: SpoIIE family protein phosphatase [Lentisphaeria bacterium]|nr:SpoIIE family protein phosphatase [Lentisphaeria bacterium]